MPLPSSHALPLLRFTALQRSIHSPLCLSSHSSSKHPHAFTNLTPSHHVSSSSTSKNSSKRTGSLAKPDRFRPPSHPSGREHALAAAARRRRNPFADGPPLSSAERIAQKVRRYPNTFPAKGTVTRKVLTNRMLHVWVSLFILISITVFILVADFITQTPYYDDLPPLSSFLGQPIAFLSTYWRTYIRHVNYNTMVTQEKRQRKIEDAQKRREFRIAHGLEEGPPTPALPGTIVAGGVGKDAQIVAAPVSGGSGDGVEMNKIMDGGEEKEEMMLEGEDVVSEEKRDRATNRKWYSWW